MPSVLHLTEGTWGRSTIFKDKNSREANGNKSQEKVKDGAKSQDDVEAISLSGLSLEQVKGENEKQEDQEKETGDVPEKTEHTILPCLYSSLFGTILEDTITQLQILVEGSNELKLIKTKLDMDFLLRTKFGVEEPDSVDKLEGIDLKNLGCNEYKIKKLESDRMYIIDVIKRTYMDLSLHKSFKALIDSVNAIIALDNYRIALAEEEARNRTLRRDFARQLRQLRNHIKTVLYDSEVKIDGLIAQVEDSVLVSECRSRYVDNWQRARTEQHEETIRETEVVYTDSIEYYKRRTDHEHRVHMEVEMLINIAINDILQEIEDRMTKYDTDIETIQLKIQIKRNDYQNMLERRIGLENTIAEHDRMMNEWVYFKDEREKLRQYREKMTNAAIAVQAWWRGLLVRRQLGPFKPPKKKKQPPKKKF